MVIAMRRAFLRREGLRLLTAEFRATITKKPGSYSLRKGPG
jgi:hypothetical protein